MKTKPLSRRITFLGDYVPRRCGIATFTHSLFEAVAAGHPDAECTVAAVSDRPESYDYPPQVRIEFQQPDLDSYRAAGRELARCQPDVLCVQHEFGIYGGPAGSHLIALLKEVRMPVVTTLHTVLREPDAAQRHVMDELARLSDRLVVMAAQGAQILKDTYGIPASMIDVIPHGIPEVPFSGTRDFKQRLGLAGQRVLLTFGLIGPGKGIEHAIRAMPEIVARHPEATYVVLGATHPHLIAREGEKYRASLEQLAADLGVADRVIFHDRYATADDLREFIGATDIYLTPYLNEAQITSGALAQVFGAGRAVVSTPYWHARELLADDLGVLVPFRDPAAIAAAVNGLLDDPAALERTSRRAYEASRETLWPAVARSYLESFDRAKTSRRDRPSNFHSTWPQAPEPGKLPPVRLEHLNRMTDGTGIYQHAIFNVPNFHEGYCTDDNARAFILCHLLDEAAVPVPAQKANLDLLATRYLAFLAAAFHGSTGRFRNFMNHERRWLEDFGSEDSHGRALWAVGSGAARSRNEGHRRLSAQLFERGLPAVLSFTSPRSWAFALLGSHEFEKARPRHPENRAIRDELVERLLARWNDCADDTWPWFESCVTYDNARLSQALILSGRNHPRALEAGLKSLRWLAGHQHAPAGHFRPIGSNGFHEKDGERAVFDQQPVEAQAMVAACLEAFRATHDGFWWREARRAFEWFLGRNDLGIPLHDSTSGGCRDGLHHDRPNENQGAESTLAFQLALAELTAEEHALTHPLRSAS